jgi:ABC-type transporter Mla MlaB component
MVTYAVVPAKGGNETKMTLYVEGEVNSKHWDRLREFCLEAMKASDDLVLDLEKVGEYDFSLSFFVCLLRRTAMLLGKRLKIRGGPEGLGCAYRRVPGLSARCSITGAKSCCLCENLFTGTPLGDAPQIFPGKGERSR